MTVSLGKINSRVGVLVKLNLVTMAFAALTVLPQAVKAEIKSINECVSAIQSHWLPASKATYAGHTRMQTPCTLKMNLAQNSLSVDADGTPLSVDFELAPSQGETTRTLQTCKVDKEKLHFVFEEISSNGFEKRDRVQMTLLKRHGSGLTLILSKRDNKLLRPLQQSSLICHLN